MTTEPYAGMWDFDGSCAPGEDGNRYVGRFTYASFTLGCFQWMKRGRGGQGKGLKRGRVQHRVKGLTADPKPAYEAARVFCAEKNTGNSTT